MIFRRGIPSLFQDGDPSSMDPLPDPYVRPSIPFIRCGRIPIPARPTSFLSIEEAPRGCEADPRFFFRIGESPTLRDRCSTDVASDSSRHPARHEPSPGPSFRLKPSLLPGWGSPNGSKPVHDFPSSQKSSVSVDYPPRGLPDLRRLRSSAFAIRRKGSFRVISSMYIFLGS